MSESIFVIKTLYYIVFVVVLCGYMSKTDIRIKDNYPVEDTLLFRLLKMRMDKIENQTFGLYFAFFWYCQSFVSLIDYFNLPWIISLIITTGLFALGVAISLIYMKIKKHPDVIVYEHNDEKGLLNRVEELESLYNATKYMIFGTILLVFV
jgi:hypothetical protein